MHRPETLAIIGKIFAPTANNLQLNLDGDEEPEKARLSREELEKQLARWGIKINMIFHGDEGRRPMKLIEHRNNDRD